MISLMPTVSAQDTNGALAIVAMISDPAASKARLAELVAQAQANEKSTAEAIAAQKKAASDKAEAERIKEQASESLAASQAAAADLAKKTTEHAALAESLSQREAAITAAELAAKNDLHDRETAIANRETETKAKFDKASADAAEAAKMRTDYEKKLTQLKAIIGS